MSNSEQKPYKWIRFFDFSQFEDQICKAVENQCAEIEKRLGKALKPFGYDPDNPVESSVSIMKKYSLEKKEYLDGWCEFYVNGQKILEVRPLPFQLEPRG